MKIKWALLSTVLVFLLAGPAPVRAEGFAEIFGGVAFSQGQDVTVVTGSSETTSEADFENSGEAGYRMGYWFEAAPWLGLALEVSYFTQNFDEDSDLTIIPATPLLMLAFPFSEARNTRAVSGSPISRRARAFSGASWRPATSKTTALKSVWMRGPVLKRCSCPISVCSWSTAIPPSVPNIRTNL